MVNMLASTSLTSSHDTQPAGVNVSVGSSRGLHISLLVVLVRVFFICSLYVLYRQYERLSYFAGRKMKLVVAAGVVQSCVF
jgi:hypothetical protein